jgi:type I restriction enzyme, S subunit
VTGRYGTLGDVYYLDRDYWPPNTALRVADFKGNDPCFVACFPQSVLRNYQRHGGGSGRGPGPGAGDGQSVR